MTIEAQVSDCRNVLSEKKVSAVPLIPAARKLRQTSDDIFSFEKNNQLEKVTGLVTR